MNSTGTLKVMYYPCSSVKIKNERICHSRMIQSFSFAFYIFFLLHSNHFSHIFLQVSPATVRQKLHYEYHRLLMRVFKISNIIYTDCQIPRLGKK